MPDFDREPRSTSESGAPQSTRGEARSGGTARPRDLKAGWPWLGSQTELCRAGSFIQGRNGVPCRYPRRISAFVAVTADGWIGAGVGQNQPLRLNARRLRLRKTRRVSFSPRLRSIAIRAPSISSRTLLEHVAAPRLLFMPGSARKLKLECRKPGAIERACLWTIRPAPAEDY